MTPIPILGRPGSPNRGEPGRCHIQQVVGTGVERHSVERRSMHLREALAHDLPRTHEAVRDVSFTKFTLDENSTSARLVRRRRSLGTTRSVQISPRQVSSGAVPSVRVCPQDDAEASQGCRHRVPAPLQICGICCVAQQVPRLRWSHPSPRRAALAQRIFQRRWQAVQKSAVDHPRLDFNVDSCWRSTKG